MLFKLLIDEGRNAQSAIQFLDSIGIERKLYSDLNDIVLDVAFFEAPDRIKRSQQENCSVDICQLSSLGISFYIMNGSVNSLAGESGILFCPMEQVSHIFWGRTDLLKNEASRPEALSVEALAEQTVMPDTDAGIGRVPDPDLTGDQLALTDILHHRGDAIGTIEYLMPEKKSSELEVNEKLEFDAFKAKSFEEQIRGAWYSEINDMKRILLFTKTDYVIFQFPMQKKVKRGYVRATCSGKVEELKIRFSNPKRMRVKTLEMGFNILDIVNDRGYSIAFSRIENPSVAEMVVNLMEKTYREGFVFESEYENMFKVIDGYLLA